MKKLIYIFVILLTFSIGVVIYYMRAIVTPVSLCEISQHAELYQLNDIHIKAYLDIGIDGKYLNIFELKKGCDSANADLWFSEKFEENLPEEKLSEELKKLIQQLKEQTTEDKRAVVEVEVTGKIKERASACFALPFYVQVKDIEQVSEIKLINLPETFKKRKADK